MCCVIFQCSSGLGWVSYVARPPRRPSVLRGFFEPFSSILWLKDLASANWNFEGDHAGISRGSCCTFANICYSNSQYLELCKLEELSSSDESVDEIDLT